MNDLPLILSTWLRSYKYDSPLTWPIRNKLFFDNEQELIELILGRPHTKTLIVCDEESPDLIFAYLVSEGLTIHWAYTKKPFRLQGLMTKLIKEAGLPERGAGCYVSHFTKSVEELWKAKKFQAEFNPYAGFWGIRERKNQRA